MNKYFLYGGIFMNSKKTRLIATIIMLVTIVLAVGCTVLRKPGTSQTTPNQGQTELFPNQTPIAGGQRLSTTQKSDNINTTSNIQRANTITKQLISIGNIKRATVLIDGKTAIVGVEFIDKNNKVIMDKLVNYNNNIKPKTSLPQASTGVNDSRQTGLAGTSTQINLTQAPITSNNSINSNTNPKDAIASIVKSLDNEIANVLATTESSIVNRIQKLNSGMSNEINYITKKIQETEK
jgi:hypothetical protein